MKRLILIFILLISTTALAATFVTVGNKSTGDALTAAEFQQILDALKNGTISIKSEEAYTTGRQDGTAGVTISTAGSPTTISSSNNKSAYYFNIGNSDANSVYTLPTPVKGEQYCVTNYQVTGTAVITKPSFKAPANVYLVVKGVITGTQGTATAGGAAGDSACAVGVDSTHYVIYPGSGTWTPSAP